MPNCLVFQPIKELRVSLGMLYKSVNPLQIISIHLLSYKNRRDYLSSKCSVCIDVLAWIKNVLHVFCVLFLHCQHVRTCNNWMYPLKVHWVISKYIVVWFRPQLLVLSGYPKNRPALVDFAYSITKKQSLLMCGHVFTVIYLHVYVQCI